MNPDPPNVAEAVRLLTAMAAIAHPVDANRTNATAVVMAAYEAAVKERDELRLSDEHPSDCQSCSEDGEPCATHAEDWRYWQALSEDMEAEYADALAQVLRIDMARIEAVNDRDTARALLARVSEKWDRYKHTSPMLVSDYDNAKDDHIEAHVAIAAYLEGR